MEGVLQIGLRAIREGLGRLNRDAERATRAFTPDSTEDAVSALVDLKQDALGIRAGVAIVRTGSDLSKYTLDIIA